MMIGFGYVTKNFLCFTGGNARDLMSVIIPLIDIKSVCTSRLFHFLTVLDFYGSHSYV